MKLMKGITKHKPSLLWGLMACALVSTGCKDGDFDFDEIEATVGLGGDELTLPSDNTTKDITLEDILELNNSDFVSIATNGDYTLDMADEEWHGAYPKVDRFVARNATAKGGSLPLGIPTTKRTARASGAAFTIASFNFRDVKVPDGISDLRYIGGEASLTLALEVPSTVRQISTLRLSLPAFLDVATHTLDGKTAEIDSRNTITITNLKPGSHRVTVTGRGMHVGRDDAHGTALFDRTTGTMDIDGEITATATVAPADVHPSAIASGDLGSMETTLSVSDILVTSAQGRFNPVIDFDNLLGAVTLNSVPDFMQGNAVCLNLYNPQIYITFENELPLGGFVSGRLVASDKAGEAMAEVGVPRFAVPKGVGVVCISKQRMSFAGDTTNVVVPALSSLVKTIPHRIRFTDIVAQGDDSEFAEMRLGHKYSVMSQYHISCPLQFDEGATIVYRDSTDGWNDTMKDLSFVQSDISDPTSIDGYLTVELDVANKIPAYLTITPTAMDSHGRPIGSDRMTTEVDKAIAASEDGVTPRVTHVTLTMRPRDNNALHELDGVKYEVVASSSDGDGQNPITGKTINAHAHTLKLSGIKVTKHGKMAGDF